MIIESRRWLTWIHFSPKVLPSFFTVYLQSPKSYFKLGLIRESFYTKRIDLSKSEEELWMDYSSKLRYKIRRARKDNLIYKCDEDYSPVLKLFPYTIIQKGLNPINESTFSTKKHHLTTSINTEEEALAAHFYLFDNTAKIALLLYAASAFRKYTDPTKRYLIGRAHRLLFHKDFIYLKSLGYRTYDFGGYSNKKNDPSILGVNKFKSDFGGSVIKQYNYYPIHYYLYSKARTVTKNLLHRNK